MTAESPAATAPPLEAPTRLPFPGFSPNTPLASTPQVPIMPPARLLNWMPNARQMPRPFFERILVVAHRFLVLPLVVLLATLAGATPATNPASAPATLKSSQNFATPAEALKDCPKNIAPPKGTPWTQDNDDKYHLWNNGYFKPDATLRAAGKVKEPMALNSGTTTINIDAGTASIGDQTVNILIVAIFPDELRAKVKSLKAGDQVTIEGKLDKSDYQRPYGVTGTIYFVIHPAAFK